MRAGWVVVVAAGCDDTLFGVAPEEAGPVPTWAQDVLPILETRCVGCHAPGQIGPFALETYEDAAAWAPAVANAAEAGTMPPWPPDPGCNRYVGERLLSDAEVATLAAWSDGGTPEGDAENPVHGSASAAGLARVDLEAPIPVPYTPPADPDDDYRCFLLPLAAAQDVYVTGFRALPGDAAIVHHVIAYLAIPDLLATYEALDAAEAGPGWTCFGGPGGDVETDAAWLGGWVPGSLGDNYPEGTGILVPAGSSAVVQIHYNTSYADPGPDQTRLQVSIAPDVDRAATLIKWLDPGWLQDEQMVIPAGEADVVHRFEAPNPIGLAGRVWAAGLHQHLLGTRSSLAVTDAGGGDERCLVDIPRWDFHWQGNYFLQEPIDITATDHVALECHFDNSAGATDVSWGEGSADEMCLGLLYATLQ